MQSTSLYGDENDDDTKRTTRGIERGTVLRKLVSSVFTPLLVALMLLLLALNLSSPNSIIPYRLSISSVRPYPYGAGGCPRPVYDQEGKGHYGYSPVSFD